VLAVLWRRPWIVVRLLIVLLAAEGLTAVLKHAFDRPRPAVAGGPDPLVHLPGSPAMPSGHALVAFACAATLASIAPRLAIPLYLLATGIALSRVVVGVHYPADVLVGAVLGLALAWAVGRASPTLERLRAPRG